MTTSSIIKTIMIITICSAILLFITLSSDMDGSEKSRLLGTITGGYGPMFIGLYIGLKYFDNKETKTPEDAPTL